MEESKNLSKKVVNSTKWSAFTQVLSKLVSPIVNLILARLLTPEAFGIVASLTVVTTFADVFTDAGFHKYLIQHQFDSDDDFEKSANVAFWTNLSISAFAVFIIVLFRDGLAKLVGSEGEGLGIAVSALVILITAFSSIQTAVYQRKFAFKSLFKIRLVTVFIPLAVTVPLAFILKNYWALVIGTLSVKLVDAVLMTILSSWKPRFSYSFSKLKEMFSFSIWTLFESISIWLATYAGTFIVGNLLSTYYLGLYKTSMTTVNSYMAIITSSTTPVMFSALSKKQDDRKEYMKIFYSFQSYVSMLVIPLGVGIFIYRDFVVAILLGSQWVEAELFLGLWGLTAGLAAVTSTYCSEIYRSLGKPRISLVVQCIYLLILIPSIYFSARSGYEVLILVVPLITVALLVIHLLTLAIILKMNSLRVITNIIPQILSALVMGLVGAIIRPIFGGIWWTILSVFICIVAYFAVLICFPKQRKMLYDLPITKKALEMIGKRRKKL